jgi:N-acetylglucosamine malate deacetylase 1
VPETVLVLAPHPDDESIGCGGALALHSQRGDHISAVFLTSGEAAMKQFAPEDAWRIREAEAQAAADVLGIAELTFLRAPDSGLQGDMERVIAAVLRIFGRRQPRCIYTPHENEAHPDHKAAFAITQAILERAEPYRPEVRGYEIWTPHTFFQHLEDVTSVMDRKLAAIRCHKSQVEDIRYDDAIAGLNRYRGAIAGCGYAEAFATLE